MEREETMNMTEELDDKWRELLRDNASLFTANKLPEKTKGFTSLFCFHSVD